MYRFQCDYTEGAHPAIMQRMVETNMEQTDGYGLDPYCDSARQKIKDLCECQDADVHFLVGGTQTNTTVTLMCMRPEQLKQPDIKYCRFQVETERSVPYR